MENVSFLLPNSSDDAGNSSLLREFPYWQPTLAVATLILVTLPFGHIIGIYLPLIWVLIRMLKKDNFKALNLIHLTLLIASIVEDGFRIILYPLYLPSIFRYCDCSDSISSAIGFQVVFFLIYRPFSFASLSVLQCLVIVGKKKYATLKVSCGIIAVCIVLAIIYAASVVKPIYDTTQDHYCYEHYCPNSGSDDAHFGSFSIIYFSLIFIAYVPTLAVVITMSVCSCAVFKTYYTGGDDQLNRRMIFLPFIMPLFNIISGILDGAITVSVGNTLSMIPALGDLFPYWAHFISTILLTIFRFLSRLVYPMILLYTHTKVRKAIKRLLRRLKNRNRVIPGGENVETTPDTN